MEHTLLRIVYQRKTHCAGMPIWVLVVKGETISVVKSGQTKTF